MISTDHWLCRLLSLQSLQTLEADKIISYQSNALLLALYYVRRITTHIEKERDKELPVPASLTLSQLSKGVTPGLPWSPFSPLAPVVPGTPGIPMEQFPSSQPFCVVER